jgi:histidinol-phosphate aminotransferase
MEGSELLQLAQNENYADASQRALAAARDACGGSTRYPDPDACGLRSAIAERHELQTDRIVCARGAMELISLLATAYLEPGASAVISEFG